MVEGGTPIGDPGFWAEPVNAITNAAFIVAAILLFKMIKTHGLTVKKHWDIVLLSVLVFVIGIGSFMFHTQATEQAMMMDVIPITLFVNIFFLSLLLRALKMPVKTVAIFFVGFQVATYLVGKYMDPNTLNGSVMYLVPYLTLVGMLVYMKTKHHPWAKDFMTIVLIFTVSIVFRTVDFMVCGSFALGTHFMWHVLNAAVLYLLVKGLIQHGLTVTTTTKK